MFEVFKGHKLVCGVEVFVVFPMRTLDFSVMPWCVRANKFMLDPELSQGFFEERRLYFFCVRQTL